MRFGLLTIIAILSYAGAATAFPRLNKQAMPQRDCVAQRAVFTSNTGDFSAVMNEMRHDVALSKEVRAYPLNALGEDKISAGEQLALNKAVGRCKCEVRVGNKVGRSQSDCTLAGVSGTNRTILANSHLVRDFFANGEPMPGLKCHFSNNYGDAPVELVFQKGFYEVGTLDKNDPGNDRVTVRLAKPIPNAQEIPILSAGAEVTEKSTIYAVSAGLKDIVGTDDLVVQEPTVLSAGPKAFLDNSTSIKVKSSGAPYLTRVQGQLVMVGMVQGGARDDKNNQPSYTRDPSTGKMVPNNVTRGVVIDSEAVADILSVERKAGQKMVQSTSLLPAATQGL